jgi:glycosyltransferase involved in cell wall biosynthesis
MQSHNSLTIVIPAYNEAESLPNIMGELIAFCEERNWHIIIVNDGSRDNTKDILKKYEGNKILKVIHHKLNRGYGGALKTGISNVTTKYCVTIDSDGQHDMHDVEIMYKKMIETNADLIVGNRRGNAGLKLYREFGKSIIRSVANILMPLTIYDINSGMKMYDSELAKRYINICPNGMAFSDIIALTFIYQRNLVLEMPIRIKERIGGKSTIGMKTAFETVMEIVNIVTLFNPLRIFLPLSLFFITIALMWEIRIFIFKGPVVSTGALLGFITGLIFFLLGLIAEQLGNLRRHQVLQD